MTLNQSDIKHFKPISNYKTTNFHTFEDKLLIRNLQTSKLIQNHSFVFIASVMCQRTQTDTTAYC